MKMTSVYRILPTFAFENARMLTLGKMRTRSQLLSLNRILASKRSSATLLQTLKDWKFHLSTSDE